ncbi:hypothetical protein MARCHEWKA_02350 [Brevundimonas phage vB_BpoS-Marchewka]|uniref:Transmembrane protein n=1 Tax=Brevundimonas phage vB_BpoS-Marchewka TaxID=2948604 RepID=A0A9E7STU8_9CAUD|nr:hypothetical protein MARCHEWKA_02350 [Brevundimonas phage vB_BpoS-Marchewka]UTC29194.1 hypothetical protein BAMBUS_01120 [Brevundimonas phage vB_BpoS-Bambus]
MTQNEVIYYSIAAILLFTGLVCVGVGGVLRFGGEGRGDCGLWVRYGLYTVLLAGGLAGVTGSIAWLVRLAS